MRVGVEIAIPDRRFTFREQILFFGKINDGQFSTALVGKKNGRDLQNWDNWTRNYKFGDQVVQNPWESGITIINSTIDANT